MRKNSADFKTSFVSEAGSFVTNKDYFAFAELDDYACWVVADGIDSDEEQQSAEIVVQTVFEQFLERPTLSRMTLKRYLKNAHEALRDESRNVRLKASLAVVFTDYTKMIWASIGNARLYHFRNKRLNFKSKDQSISQLMAESGKIGEDEINEHEERNNLLNYFGTLKPFKVTLSKKVFLNDGDVLLLCTAGFWENATNTEIIDLLKDAAAPDELADNLEELILQKNNNTLDNFTIATVFANKVFKDNSEQWTKRTKKIAMAVVAVVLVLLVVVFIGKNVRAFQAKKMAQLVAMKKEHQRVEQLKANIETNEKKGDQLVEEGDYKMALRMYKGAEEGLALVKDKEKEKDKKRVRKKVEITQMINDADDLFAKKDYEMALLNYSNADLDAAEWGYSRKKLQEKILVARGCQEALTLSSQGDMEFDRRNYQSAKLSYNKAASIADKVGYDDIQGELEAKLSAVEQKIMETQERESGFASAKKMERLGDQKAQVKSFKEAIDFYAMAKGGFEELGMVSEMMVVQTKLQNVESMNEDYQTAKQYEKQGNERYSSKKYEEAMESYTMAKKGYEDLDMKKEIAAMDIKIEDTKKKIRWYQKWF